MPTASQRIKRIERVEHIQRIQCIQRIKRLKRIKCISPRNLYFFTTLPIHDNKSVFLSLLPQAKLFVQHEI